MKQFFKSKEDFHNVIHSKLMSEYKCEIWWDDFSIDYPYIRLNVYEDGKKFHGEYTDQSLLGGKMDDLTWLYTTNELYIKN